MRCLNLIALFAFLIAAECLGELDYYRAAVYPGAELRSDVEAPALTIEPAPAGEPARRIVTFWPRRGVDVIPVDDRMPLRTWSFQAEAGDEGIWGRKPGVPEAGKDPSYREAYWDCLSSFEDNVRAGLVLAVVRGYLIPPTSGRYTFYYAADDRGSFHLSSDESPANLEPLAYNRDYARKMNYFFRGPEQTSRVVTLEAGKKYFFEASYVDVGGGSWMSVAWRFEGRLYPEIIAGRYLESPDGKKGYAKAHYYEPAAAPPVNRYIAGKTLKAHLIGFRGVGNASIESPKSKTAGRRLPAVVLRLPDGRKRAFGADIFSPEDQDYLEQEFIKARKRIYDASDKTPHKAKDRITKSPRSEPGTPGMLCEETDHMSWYAGSQSAPGNNSPWVNEVDLEEGRIYREAVKAWSENMWLLEEYAGYPIYTWRYPPGRQTKYEVTVAGTMKNGYDVISGYAGGGRGGCVAAGAATGILAHEWGHGSGAGYGMEGDSDTFATFCFPGPKGNPHVKNATWRNFYGANENMYGLCSFGTLWGDDPNWGYGFYIAAPRGVEEPDVAYTYARLMEQRGFVKEGDGIRGFGDLAGEYGARLTTFDYELEADFQNAYYTPTLSLMERIDADRPLYRIHSDYEPEAFGMNMVRLDAAPDATDITVTFSGMRDPATHGDWRACLIAVDADGRRRYSPLWNRGAMSLAIRPDDASHFLTVTATPTALTSKRDRGISPTGRFAPVYPWQAEIRGAVPGSTAKRLGDLGSIETGYASRLLAPRRTAAGTIAKIKAYHAALQKIAASEPGNEQEAHKRFFAMLNMTTYQTVIDMLGPGKPHKNGGGWVADTADVDETAYVGPHAMVVGASRIRDHAVIEDTAVILGRSDISGHAKVSGGAVVGDKFMDGYARCWDEVQDVDGHVRPLPLRAGRKAPRPDGLWINYAMNGDSGIRLADSFRNAVPLHQENYHKPFGISLHGFVYGAPQYVKIDSRWGLRIADASQFAVLNQRAVDLGAITLALTLRREKATAGTVLDLGSNRDNCMVLTLSRQGRPEFVAVRGGKTVLRLAGATAIPLNQWATLRVEIDGSESRLVVNGKPEATVKTAFRPCDVALPDVPQSSLMGNSRTKNSPLQGVLDELVIYSCVNENFDALLPPVVNCPIRPSEGALEAVTAYAAFVQAHNAGLKDAGTPEDDGATATGEFAEQLAYYKALKPRMEARLEDLYQRSPAVREVEAKLEAREAEYKALQKTLTEEEVKRFEKQIGDLKQEVAEARKHATAPYAPEFSALHGNLRGYFSGHYNVPLTRYTASLAGETAASSGALAGTDKPDDIGKLLDTWSSGKMWRTQVDWDWRTPEEAKGNISDLPLLQKWIRRIRGPVVTNRPAGSNPVQP